MKISCNIIRDLLPLYAEDLASEDTRALVDDHLCQCDACTKELGALKKAPKLPVDVETNALKWVKRSIVVRRILTAAAAVATLLSLCVSFWVFLMTPIYLPVDKAIEDVYLQEDGGLVIDYARGVMGTTGLESFDGSKLFMGDTTRYDWYKAKQLDKMLAEMSEEEIEDYIKEKYQTDEVTPQLLDRFYGKEVSYCFENQQGQYFGYSSSEVSEEYREFLAEVRQIEGPFELVEHKYSIVYLNADGTPGKVLWTEDKWTQEGVIADVGNVLWEQTFYGCLICAAALSGWYFFGKKEKRKEWKVTLFLAFASIAFGIGLVSNFSFGYGSLTNSCNWWEFIWTEIPLVFVTALLWRKLYVMNKRDKGL